MKVLVMGAGKQGAAAASICAKDNVVESIILADINLELADKVAAKINSEKITTKMVNANEIDDIAAAAKGCDVIMDFCLPWHVPNVMQAALKAGTHYVNSAYDAPFWDQLVNGEKLYLYDEFEKAGLSALLGCGGCPGIYNVVARLYADKMDTVESVYYKCLEVPNTSLENKVKPWNPGWAPAQALIDFSVEPIIFEDGKYKRMPIFSGLEYYDFKGTMPPCPAAYHSHEEAYQTPYCFKDKGIKNCNFKYLVDEQAATFVKMGFVPDKVIKVDGQQVKPFDVLISMVEKASDGFLNEVPPTGNEKFELLYPQCTEVNGTKDGKPVSYTVMIDYFYAHPIECYNACGCLGVSVALPVVLGAKMLIEGAKKGVIFAEELNPNRFMELVYEKIPSFELKEI